jgi:hypothetical protein
MIADSVIQDMSSQDQAKLGYLSLRRKELSCQSDKASEGPCTSCPLGKDLRPLEAMEVGACSCTCPAGSSGKSNLMEVTTAAGMAVPVCKGAQTGISSCLQASWHSRLPHQLSCADSQVKPPQSYLSDYHYLLPV